MRTFILALLAVLGYVWFAMLTAFTVLVLSLNILWPFDWVPTPLHVPVLVFSIGIPGLIIGLAASQKLIVLRRAVPRGFEPIVSPSKESDKPTGIL